MEGPESMPYDEIEELCRLLNVKMDIYSIKRTIQMCHRAAKDILCLTTYRKPTQTFDSCRAGYATRSPA
jgi:hypothetical protein